MPNPEALGKALPKAMEDLRRMAQVAIGRERQSEGVLGAAVGKEQLKAGREALNLAKEQAKFLRAVLHGQSAKELPSYRQTMGHFDPRTILSERAFAGSPLEGGELVGILRKMTNHEGGKSLSGYMFNNKTGYEHGQLRNLAKKLVNASTGPFGMEPHIETMAELGIDNALPFAVNTTNVKDPHTLAHTSAHEIQHLMRDKLAQQGKRSFPQLASELNLGRPEAEHVPYRWGDVPSEARAEKYADWAAGRPKRGVNGEMESMALQQARNRISGILKQASLADAPSDIRKSLGPNPDIASKDYLVGLGGKRADSWNKANRAGALGLPMGPAREMESLPGQKFQGIPARRVDRALAQHDAQLMLDRARASLSPGQYKEMLKVVRPALRDSVPNLRYALPFTIGAATANEVAE
jgi:hypothetical protein